MAPNYHIIDPCHDWDEYVCGGFKAKYASPLDRPEIDVMSIVQEGNNELVMHILTSPIDVIDKEVPKGVYDKIGLKDEEKPALRRLQQSWVEWQRYRRTLSSPPNSLHTDMADWPLQDLMATDIHEPLHLYQKHTKEEAMLKAYFKGLASATAKLASHGISVFAKYHVQLSHLEPLRAVVLLAPYTKTGLPWAHLYESRTIKYRYEKVMKEILGRFWPIYGYPHNGGSSHTHWSNKKVYRAEINVNEIIEFERRLHTIFPSEEQLKDAEHNLLPIPLHHLAALIPEIDFSLVFKEHNSAKWPKGKNPKNDLWHVEVWCHEYWYKLSALLKETPKSALHGYFMWQAFLQTEHLWDMEWTTPWRELKNDLKGIVSTIKAWEPGHPQAFPSAEAHLGSRKTDSEQDKELSSEVRLLENFKTMWRPLLAILYNRIKYKNTLHPDQPYAAQIEDHEARAIHLPTRELINIVNQTSWLPPGPKAAQMEKLGSSDAYNAGLRGHSSHPVSRVMYRTWYKKAKDWGLGSLSRLRNKKKPKFGLKKPELPTPIHDYFEAQKRHFLMAWGELYQPTGKSTWEYDLASFDVTRIISPTKSFVYLTAGLYQPPFFHDDAPTIVNLAGLGALATEGLAHSLGYYGAKYGTLSYIQDGVWSADAEKARSKQMQCLADRYDGIEVKVSQGRTSQLRGASKGLLDDAIASALGTEAAYRAWKERYKVEMPVTLPGMANFTTDQLFFILRSASSCGVESPGTLEDRIRAGRGLPVHLRTRAQVEDSQAWHDAFKCKPKAPLCPVWGPVRSPVIEEPIKLP